MSALIASVAFLPFLASQMASPLASDHAALQPAAPYLQVASVLPLESTDPTFSAYWIVLPLCIVAFLVVWLTAHAINVLIALCPFGFIDALLKLFKFFLLSSVVVSYVVSPYFGAAVSLAVICVAAVLAPWAFRLTVFGTLLAMDTILPSRGRPRADVECPHVFLACRVSGVPVRTLGRLTRDAERTTRFEYRPWLVLTKRTIALPQGSFAVSTGAFFPSLLHSVDGSAFGTLFHFPPRYRGGETAIAAQLGISDIRDGALVRSFKSVRAWLRHALA